MYHFGVLHHMQNALFESHNNYEFSVVYLCNENIK